MTCSRPSPSSAPTLALGLALAMLAACPPGVIAQEPPQPVPPKPVVIKGLEPTPVNRLVRLRMDGDIDPTTVDWLIRPSDAADGEEAAGGAGYNFTGPPGKYEVTLSWFDGKRVRHVLGVVTITGTAPKPPPSPDDPPDEPPPEDEKPHRPPTPPQPPQPPSPAGKFGLAPVIAANFPLIPPSAARQSSSVVDYFRNTAAVADRFPDATTLNNAAGLQLKANLGADYAAWRPFMLAVVKQLNAAVAAGKIASTADAADAYLELADALEGMGR